MENNLLEKTFYKTSTGLSGLGGWLILVQMNLYGRILMLFIQLALFTLPAFNAETWEALTSKTSELYHPLWGPVIVFDTMYIIIFLVLCIYILIMFYRKKSLFPRLMIGFYSASFIVALIDLLILYQIPSAFENNNGSLLRIIVKSILTCVIWIPYFVRSIRVKNTFVM